jgi:peptidoglycan/LPS O-acetylase OafA/YrhL
VSTLGEALDPRRNSINAIRLFFCISILLLHCVPLSGHGPMPKLIFADTIGTYALSGFFALSGYLITASRLSSKSTKDYLWRRVLRIYPAWVASLLFVAVITGPLSLWLEGKSGYDWNSAFHYVVDNLWLALRALTVDGTLTEVPIQGVWNFSAWTLFYEFALWIGMAVLVSVFRGRWLKPGMWLGLVTFTLIKLAHQIQSGSTTVAAADDRTLNAQHSGTLLTLLEPLARLGIFFMAGAVLYIYRDRVRIAGLWALAAFGISAGLAIFGLFHTFAALPWAYLMVWFATSKRFGSVNYPDDYSYGMYIYAYPVTQLVATFALAHPMPMVVFMLITTALTAPVAWLSWRFLEKPAMRLKRLTAGADKAVIGIAPGATSN